MSIAHPADSLSDAYKKRLSISKEKIKSNFPSSYFHSEPCFFFLLSDLTIGHRLKKARKL